MDIQGVSFNRSNCLSNKSLIPQSHSFTSSKNFNLRSRPFSATVLKSNSISYSMKSYKLSELTKPEVDSLKTRPRIDFSSIFGVVNPIVDDVRNRGDAAIVDYTAKFDKVKLDKIVERVADLPDPELDPAVREAFDVAYDNIHAFHTAQKNTERNVENMKGVRCKRVSRCIKSVGLYVPGGTAVLPSTALMLSVPAQIAGCKTVVLATPPSGDGGICKEVLYCAKRAGVTHILKAGGAQAISAMAWGTASCPKEPIALPFEAASTKNAAPKAQVLKAAKALKSGESTPKKRVKKSVTFSCKKTLKKAKNPKHHGDSAPRKNKLDHYEILKYPLITESTMKKMKGKKSLVFIVDRRADKKNIKAAIENIYDTRTKKVNTLMRPDGTKKAYVTLTSDSGS